MKNIFCLLPLISILFFACQIDQKTPLEKVDHTLVQPNPASIGFSNVQLFTTGKSLSTSNQSQLMKMSIDYQTQFNQMGIFLFLDEKIKDKKSFRELATIDLSDDKNEDGIYLGRKILSLSEKSTSKNTDNMLYEIVSHGITPDETPQSLIQFKIGKPNSYPYGIQQYEKHQIPEGEMIHLYSLNLRTGNGMEQTGYQAELILVGYDSDKKEELLEQLEFNIYNVLVHNDDFLTIPNSLELIGEQMKEQSDYLGFAFGEDGK